MDRTFTESPTYERVSYNISLFNTLFQLGLLYIQSINHSSKTQGIKCSFSYLLKIEKNQIYYNIISLWIL